jgi:UDP-glucose-4-epimerase GalE
MTILVTGGAGFIGGHTVLALLDRGEVPIVLDDLSTGTRAAVQSGVPLYVGDVGDTRLVSRLIEEHDIDAILHFAAKTKVPESVTDPLGYYFCNTLKTHTLLQAAVHANVKHFIFSSTAAVYGNPRILPVTETADLNPLSPYGRSKLMSEQLLADVGAAHGLHHLTLRYFNVAGADPNGRLGQSTRDATHLIKVALETALGRRSYMNIYGSDYPTPDGTCVRDYVHVSDLARAHLIALDYLRSDGASRVLNCGYGRGYSVKEVVHSVRMATGIDFVVKHAPRRAGDPAEVVANSDELMKLGWKPQLNDLSTMVGDALNWERTLQAMLLSRPERSACKRWPPTSAAERTNDDPKLTDLPLHDQQSLILRPVPQKWCPVREVVSSAANEKHGQHCKMVGVWAGDPVSVPSHGRHSKGRAMDAQQEVRDDAPEPNTPTTAPFAGVKRLVLLFIAGALGVAAVAAAGPFRTPNLAADIPAASATEKGTIPGTRDEVQTSVASAAELPTATTGARNEGAANDPPRSDSIDSAPSLATSTRPLGIGDKLKVVFYERVDTEDEKWGRTPTALRGIQQRPELSGDYAVRGDGTISVPLLGSVRAAAQSEPQVKAALAEAFEKTLGRKAIVDVMLQASSPVYVLGPVRHPGSFNYVPGMTVLHALALAGGLDRASVEPWQKIEAIRTIQRRGGAAESILKLLARVAVLRAERDGTTPKAPLQLKELVGAAQADGLINEQVDQRKAVAMARKEREQAANAAVDTARQDLTMYTRTDSLDELVKTRQERLDNIRSLVRNNVLNKTTLDQAQAELSDAEQRRQDAFNRYSTAKQRLATLSAEALRARADLANDLASEIQAIERQIADNQNEFATSEKILSTLPATRAEFPSPKKDSLRYRIVRQTANGPVALEGTGMTVLKPGDLINIVGGGSAEVDQQPDDQAPFKRAADHEETPLTAAQN